MDSCLKATQKHYQKLTCFCATLNIACKWSITCKRIPFRPSARRASGSPRSWVFRRSIALKLHVAITLAPSARFTIASCGWMRLCQPARCRPTSKALRRIGNGSSPNIHFAMPKRLFTLPGSSSKGQATFTSRREPKNSPVSFSPDFSNFVRARPGHRIGRQIGPKKHHLIKRKHNSRLCSQIRTESSCGWTVLWPHTARARCSTSYGRAIRRFSDCCCCYLIAPSSWRRSRSILRIWWMNSNRADACAGARTRMRFWKSFNMAEPMKISAAGFGVIIRRN